MPIYVTPLIVIVAVALVVMALFRHALPTLLPPDIARRLGWAFLLLTGLSFVAPAASIYFFGMVPVLWWAARSPATDSALGADPRVMLWFGLLLAVPPIQVTIGGIAGIGYLFSIDHVRALSLWLLVPVLWRRPGQAGDAQPRWSAADLAVLSYLAVSMGLGFMHASLTNWLRESFTLTLDLLVPYLAISRVVRSLEGQQQVMGAFLRVALVMACLGCLETLRGWPFYDAVKTSWNEVWTLSTYLMRDGLLRARTSTGHSLAFGFVMVVGLCLWTGIWHAARSRVWALLGGAALLAGLLASLSRGSWLGAVAAALCLALTSTRPVRNTGWVLLGGGVLLAVLASRVDSFGVLVARLFGSGTAASENMEPEYREQLFDTAMALLVQSPVTGVPDYMRYMEHLRQGQGIIDIVNSFLGVALGGGLMALLPFAGIFALPLWGLWRLFRRVGPDSEAGRLASALMAATVAEVVMLTSTSSISVIMPVYMAVAGLSVALLRQQAEPAKAVTTRRHAI